MSLANDHTITFYGASDDLVEIGGATSVLDLEGNEVNTKLWRRVQRLQRPRRGSVHRRQQGAGDLYLERLLVVRGWRKLHGGR